MASFSADISTFIKKTKIKGELVVKKLAFDAFRGVMLKSPVDTGRFRASWRVGLNTIDLSVAAEHQSKTEDGKGAESYSDQTGSQLAKLNGLKWGMSVSITNNIKYGPALERGHSKQAPNGMLGLTFAEVRAAFERTVRSVR